VIILLVTTASLLFVNNYVSTKSVNVQSMVNLEQYHVSRKIEASQNLFNGTKVFRNRSDLQSFVDESLANVNLNHGADSGVNTLEMALTKFNDEFFDNNSLVLHGVITDPVIGYEYLISDYNFQDNNLMITVNRQNPNEVSLPARQASVLLLEISKELTNNNNFLVDVEIYNIK